MQRKVAELPEGQDTLCLIRLGLQAHRWRAMPFASRMGRGIANSEKAAIAEGAGLLRSERFLFGPRHFGVLQYWRSFEDLEQWSHRPPHSEWWREAIERGRTRGDFGIYHETYLVPRAAIESIYLGCDPVGLSAFGTLGDPVGPRTASRDRLGLRDAKD